MSGSDAALKATFFAIGLAASLACGSSDRTKPVARVQPQAEGAESAREDARADGATTRRRGTRVVLLGTGTPIPDPRRSGPATAVVTGGRAYLVDFGAGVVQRAGAARRAGVRELDPRLLDQAFVTHLHSDHTSGYSDLILTPAMVRRGPLHVHGPPGLAEMTRHILAAYARDIEIRSRGPFAGDMAGYRVDVQEIEPGVVFEDENVKVTAFEVRHGDWKHAFGYRFDAPDRSVVISGDTAPSQSVVEACGGCDVLVHEVYSTAGYDSRPQGWRDYHAAYHTSASDLALIAAQARPKLLVLTHQLLFGDSEEALMGEIRRYYDGPVVFGNDLDVY